MSITIKTLNEGFDKRYRLLETKLKFFNNIDKDLINSAVQYETLGEDLILDNNVKCSKSAINNLVYFLRNGKECQLCLGAIKLPRSENFIPDQISHVWVQSRGKVYQTHFPYQYGLDNDSLVPSECVEFFPDDLDNFEIKIQEIIKK